MIHLLESSSLVVSEQVCRLLNAFSSLSRGRDYLTLSLPMISALCGVLVTRGGGEGGESCVTRNALGAVQKLSLKYVYNFHIKDMLGMIKTFIQRCPLMQYSSTELNREVVFI